MMHKQGMFATILMCCLLVGCSNRGQDKEVSTVDNSKQPLNKEKQEGPLALAIKSPPAPVAVEEWTSDPALQAQLGEEKSDVSFALRIPASFKWAGSSGNSRYYFDAWKSEPRDDKSVAKFTVLSGRLNTEIMNMPLEKAAAEMLKNDHQRFSKVTPGKTSTGTINGIPFYKTTFTMVEPDTSFHGRATVFHGHIGKYYIHLVYHDVEPHLAQTEKLLEAAALSVRPKP